MTEITLKINTTENSLYLRDIVSMVVEEMDWRAKKGFDAYTDGNGIKQNYTYELKVSAKRKINEKSNT